MPLCTKRLVYFEKWVDPVAEAVLGDRPDIHLDKLSYSAPTEETVALIGQAHGYQISPRTELLGPWFGDAELLRLAPCLLAISSTGSGFDVIDVDACTAAGVIVCHQGGSNSEAVAQHAIGMMLNLSKRIALSNGAMRLQDELDRFRLVGNDLSGKVVGIVGLGRIGTRTARLCAAFGMQVIAFDPYLSVTEIAQRGALKVEFPELLRTSDFVSVHCPRTRDTTNLFGAAEFSAMKRSAYFVNTARGGTYDEQALAAAVEEERIAGAGVDVFLVEPVLKSHPLLRHDRVIATPHIAGLTQEATRAMAQHAAEQWVDIFSGAVPPRLANPTAWPRYCQRFTEILGFTPQPLND